MEASDAWDLVDAWDNFLLKEESPSSVIAPEAHLQHEGLCRQVDLDESLQKCLEGISPGSMLGKVACKVDNTFLSHVNCSSFDFLSRNLTFPNLNFCVWEIVL